MSRFKSGSAANATSFLTKGSSIAAVSLFCHVSYVHGTAMRPVSVQGMAPITVASEAVPGILALAATLAAFAGAAVLYRKRRTIDSLLLLLGVACFVMMALTHVFESFAIFPALGWGQPRSIGHYIDLGAVVLGVTFVFASLLLIYARRASRSNTSHNESGSNEGSGF